MPLQPAIRRSPAIKKQGAITSGGSVGSRVLLASVVASCLLQLVGLYRPGGPPTPEVIPFLDKIGHVLIFALPVALILLHRARSTAARPTARFCAIVIVVFTAHAVISEVVQAWLLPLRSGDPYDVLADLVGTAIGYGTAVLFLSRWTGGARE